MSLDPYEQEIIKQALKPADGNKSQAARLLGLTRNALRYRLTQMGIEPEPGCVRMAYMRLTILFAFAVGLSVRLPTTLTTR